MDNIPLIFEFDVKTYIPVINATNRVPIKASKDYIFLFNRILNKFVKVPDVAEVRNVYNLNIIDSILACNIPVTQSFNSLRHSIICDENHIPVLADVKHLLLVEKISGETLRIVDSPSIRKIYNLQHPSLTSENQIQLTASINEFQQHSLTINQAEFPALFSKQLQESPSMSSQPPPLIPCQSQQNPSTTKNCPIQSLALMDKQYSQPTALDTNELQSHETIFVDQDNNAEPQVKIINSKTKRRRKNADAPRAKWKHSVILRLIHHYKENMHVMNSNCKRHEEIWQDISDALTKEGYYFSHLQCEDKWKYLKKLYVDTMDKNKESGTAENTCPYFNEFDEIYGKSHSVNPPALASNRFVTNISGSQTSSDSEEQGSIRKKRSRVSKRFESWTEIFRDDAISREEARQKRHEELLTFQREQMQTQNTLLGKILEKL